MSGQETIQDALRILKEGGLIGLPTETVYGLAANALDKEAVKKIFNVKGRPLIDPLIVHVASIAQVQEIAHTHALAEALMKNFWPGPLTIILKKKACLPSIVTGGLATVGVRMPDHPIAIEILKAFGKPLAAPSANPFKYVSPTQAKHVKQQLGDKVGMVLEGGPCKVGIESTIIDLSDAKNPIVRRLGPIEPTALEAQLGKPVKSLLHKPKHEKVFISPGQMDRHYSPHTPLELFKSGSTSIDLKNEKQTKKVAYVFQRRQATALKVQNGVDIYWLSEGGDLKEVAKNLFALIRRLDDADYAKIFIEQAEAEGLGKAINDRLERAASKSP